MFTVKFQEWVRAGARRLVVALRILGISPNVLTLCGLAICAVAGVLIALGMLVPGGIILLLASVFDILDGAVARVTGRVHRYGAFLDSTTDRYAESFTYIALLWYFTVQQPGRHTIEPMLIVLALSGSLLVSYVRARAQSLGFVCDGGLFARPERVVLTVVGLVFPVTLMAVLVILAVITNLTAVQRIWLVWRQAQRQAQRQAPSLDS